MSAVPESAERRKGLKFLSPGDLVAFLLTCLEDRDIGTKSVIFRECLNRIFVPRKGPQNLYLNVRGDKEIVRAVEHMGIANRGHIRPYRVFEPQQFHELTADRLLRSVRLQPTTIDPRKVPHVLAALWDTDSEGLARFLRYVWDLGTAQVDVAFVHTKERSVPKHFVRVIGLQHPDAFHAWCSDQQSKVDLYVPHDLGQREPRFYVAWGYRYPVPMFERLIELDRELVLLTPQTEDGRQKTNWLGFGSDEVNFFRKSYEFADIEIDFDESRLVEVREETDPEPVPLELAVIPRPGTAATQLWQLDQKIDRQRFQLHELEVARARFAAGEHDEVYLAYRFDQEGGQQLNSRLVRLMQQRLGTLSHYEYAFCQSRRAAYHLVIANRTQRQMGFSLQPADQVYYQPAQWRRWGVNLYLPLGTELAPRVSGSDVIPLLQQILERSDHAGEENGKRSLAECTAVLWDPGRGNAIRETRVWKTVPLLSRYRLLNSFQRELAADVEKNSRAKLAETIRRIRQQVGDEIDGLTRDLLGHVADRTAKLETSYSELESALTKAEGFVASVEPKVAKVTRLVLDLPNNWVEFVNRVIETHREVADAKMQAYDGLRTHVKANREHLRALALRGRDVGAIAERHRKNQEEQLTQCDEAVEQSSQQVLQLEEITKRATAVLTEIATMHKKLDARLDKIKKAEQKAERMQEEIDQIDSREKAVKQRLAKLEPTFREFKGKVAEIEKMKQTADSRQRKLSEKSIDLARARNELKARCRGMAAQLEKIEAQLHGVSEKSAELDHACATLNEQVEMIDAHREVIGIWERQKTTWNRCVTATLDENTRLAAAVKEGIDRLGNDDRTSAAKRRHLDKARSELHLAEPAAADAIVAEDSEESA